MEERKERFIKITLREIACKITCVVVSQPLQVLAIRSMAEFVGGEDKFSGGLTAGLYGGVVSILNENGILGFWSGLIPRMLGEVGILGLTASLTFLVNTYLAVSRSGLMAGSPPRMPLYTGWLDCLS